MRSKILDHQRITIWFEYEVFQLVLIVNRKVDEIRQLRKMGKLTFCVNATGKSFTHITQQKELTKSWKSVPWTCRQRYSVRYAWCFFLISPYFSPSCRLFHTLYFLKPPFLYSLEGVVNVTWYVDWHQTLDTYLLTVVAWHMSRCRCCIYLTPHYSLFFNTGIFQYNTLSDTIINTHNGWTCNHKSMRTY